MKAKQKKSMTKNEWKLFAMWAAAEWAAYGLFEWDKWHESHRRSARMLGIPTDEVKLRGVFDFCKYVTARSDYPENIEGAANAFSSEQFKGREKRRRSRSANLHKNSE